jgi:2-phosphoglycerate kinase
MPEAQDWTILLIGGPTAASKTTLAESLAARFDARYIDLDLFWIVLQRSVAPESAPELHFLDGNDVWREDPKLLVAHYLKASEYVCRAIEPLIAHHHIIGRKVVIEGCWVLPEFALQGEYAGQHVEGAVRALFLDEPDISAIEARIRARPHRWVEGLGSESRRNHLEMQRLYGETIAERARSAGLPVLASQPFESLEQRTVEVLEKPSLA